MGGKSYRILKEYFNMTDNDKKQAILKLLVGFQQKGGCPDTSDLVNKTKINK